MSESLVDLLLVRLGREEEKRKVLKLLVTSLDLSVDEAEKAVESSPSVIREAVPMAEARVIQKDLYPYIDLLPRFDDDAPQDAGTVKDDIKDVSRPSAYDDYEISEDEDVADDTDDDYEDYSVDDDPEEDSPLEDDEEDILITSAGDEIRHTTRCHICGRTPVDGERLAPCRTCGDLTCKNCFDRIAHVCNKCATSGKAVAHANHGVERKTVQKPVINSDVEKKQSSGGSSFLKTVLVVLLSVVVIGTVFYIADPVNMFSDSTDSTAVITEPEDGTAATADEDSLQTLQPDTLQTEDIADETSDETAGNRSFADPYAIRRLELAEEYSSVEAPCEIELRSSIPRSVSGAQLLSRESDMITGQLSVLAAGVPVAIDDGALLAWHDSTSVLVLVITHPVGLETRMDLMRCAADWLTPSNIDQLVLIYRENRFQSVVVWSLVAESFQDVQGVLNPSMFQNLLSYREDCWSAITGPVTEWLIGN
ncbi:hypothetical protein CSA37_04935 [Candidatus Fermentibacteria bacterium]|nr:MAG: hypothetical protein CSA37_10225 [Candidatus Fermentibacteria bacterium]PIE52273.1 MAG: hypothetical protein CSA37_07330 [Candidatus Fermentibacteria bacterium]PIE52768.1 MAG: hypothetical protein CSA37_04935 [Candidatus Fermentibacteria bacterium]